ncbi:Pol protein [Phytophthora palmivora]|uniref:RNA-directed DNA polymerase n=1 Tax=Phytophthora palmivora TaxID=4796 RepID=A0A2P4YFV2_9STRA|nr:Pol protein [Phytophthora palmivora]
MSLKVGPSRTQLFRVHANTMEEAIQIALQEKYSHRQARTPTSVWQDHNESTSVVQRAPAAGASTGPVPMELRTELHPLLRMWVARAHSTYLPCGRAKEGLEEPVAEGTAQEPEELGSPVGAGRPTGEDLSADGARHGGLAPESLGDLETRKSSGGLLVVHASERGYGYPFRILVDSGASTLHARRSHEIATSRVQVSVRLTDGTVVNVPGVRMDLAVKFEDFDSTESFLVLDMDKYDLILDMLWLEKHEPWIDWRGQAIGAIRPAVSDRALVSNVPTSVRDWGARNGHQGAYALEEVLGVTDSNEDVAMSLAIGHETKAHCQGCGICYGAVHLEALPEVSALLSLEELSMKDFLAESKAGEIAEMVLLKPETSPEDLNSFSVMDEDVLEGFTKQRATRLGSDILKYPEDPVYPLVKEYSDVVSKHPPFQLPPDRGVRHEIDLVPGTKYCVTRQWPLPREQCEVIDAFVAEKGNPSHSTPTFCVRKPNGKWRLVHAYNKLNNATVPAQTPIPRKNVLLNNMSGCTLYSALDLIDGYYQILMRESDIPLTAVSTPSGMLWEWLVMPQGLSNAPATFNRLVTQLFRPLRTFTQTYFDDIFVHSGGQTAREVHLKHLRRVFEVMRANKLYTNIDKRDFAAEEIKDLGCFVSKVSVLADPEVTEGPPEVVGLSQLSSQVQRRKDADWVCEQQHQDAFDSIKASLQQTPVLALPDEKTSHSAPSATLNDYAIGCALVQKDDEGRERVISFQSRQLKAAERNYPVHDKELLAMKYALVNFRVHLLGSRLFVIYTDHASLRTATNSPYLSQRMARWLSFFVEYNFRLNALADALSRRPDYKLARVSRVTTDLYDRIRLAYQGDENYTPLAQFLSDGKDAKVDTLSPRQRAQLHHYELTDGLLHYRVDPRDPPRVVVPNDEDLKYDILLEAHDAPISGHLGREKTYQMVSQTYWWPRMYKWVAHYCKTCEIYQRVKPSGHASAPSQSLPVPADCWKSMSLDFVFGRQADDKGNTGILVFVCRLSKMVHLAPVRDKVTGKQAAQLFLDSVFRYHGLPETIISDRDPRFTGAFWDTLFQLLGTKLTMSPADHPQTDGQAERVNRGLEDTLCSICTEAPQSWSDQLPMVEFALNNAVLASTGFTPFYLNGLRHPQVPLGRQRCLHRKWGEGSEIPFLPEFRYRDRIFKKTIVVIFERQADVDQPVNDLASTKAHAQDKQKEYSDKHSSGNLNVFRKGDLVLLDTKNLSLKVASAVESNKLNHRFIGPFAALASRGVAYTIDLPK